MSPLLAARLQMALTLGFHIVYACLGVGMPLLLIVAEGMWLRTGDPEWRTLAQRWAKAFALLFAVGAVSGTVLSFELGLLWPAFMARYGSVIGLPFTLEAFAFFVEAIFAGIYLYSWDRLKPVAHWLTGFPIAIGGIASAWFVVTVNAWMNCPQGFEEAGGKVVTVDPAAAMFNPATGAQTAHMILAAFVVTGFCVAACYAAAMFNPATGAQTAHMILAAFVVTGFCVAACYAAAILRGQDTRRHRRSLAVALALGVAATPLQALTGDWAARTVARTQPVKLAAMEGQFRTQTHAPFRIGGIPDEEAEETRHAIEIPGGLSLLAHRDASAEVKGLDAVPRDRRPPVAVVHGAFQAMIAGGCALLALSAWAAVLAFRRKSPGRRFLAAVVAAGPVAVLSMEAGWVVTEVGRQPWIVQGRMLTRDAVTASPGIAAALAAAVLVYAVLTAGTVVGLRYLARQEEAP